MKTSITKKEWYKNTILKNNPKYLISISFIHDIDHKKADKIISKFIKHIHKYIFGNNFYRKNRLLEIVIVREYQINDRIHFHILLSKNINYSFYDLVLGIQHSSKNITQIHTVQDSEIELLTLRYFNSSKKSEHTIRKPKLEKLKTYPLNVQEIEETTEEQVVEYILKAAHQNNFPIHIHNTKSKKENYFNIITDTGIRNNAYL